MKKKGVIIIIVLGLGIGGFLFYDWHAKSKKMAAEPSITLYSWTDENGKKHFTDTQPPNGAKNIEEIKGYEYVEPPLVVKLKDKTSDFFKWVKGNLFKKKSKNTKKKKT